MFVFVVSSFVYVCSFFVVSIMCCCVVLSFVCAVIWGCFLMCCCVAMFVCACWLVCVCVLCCCVVAVAVTKQTITQASTPKQMVGNI